MQIVHKLCDGVISISDDPDASKPLKEAMAEKRKGELLAWLRERHNQNMISKQEFQSRVDQIENNVE